MDEIRDYTIVAGPASGSFGCVYRGRHKTMDWERALKRLHPYIKTEVIIQEARKQQAVHSPYVVQIHEFHVDEPPTIVMEWCPTGLTEYLQDRFRHTKNTIPYDEARDLLYGVLQGLLDAHAVGIVHGDVKPANVRFGTDRLPKLGDFGAARRLREDMPGVRGSTNWMAPELLEGGVATEESDLFSFGILAYLILCGRHPFYADDPSGLTSEEDNISSPTFRPEPLGSGRNDLPLGVTGLVMELLGQPENRKAAAESLKALLAQGDGESAPEEGPAKSSVAEGVAQLSVEPARALELEYDDARRLFFIEFHPRNAIEAINAAIAHIPWRGLEGEGKQRAEGLVANMLSLRGFISNSAGRFEDAVTSADEALALDPNHVAALHVLGYALIQQGRALDAEKPLEKALQLSPNPRKREQIANLLTTARLRSGGGGIEEPEAPAPQAH